MSRLDQYIAKRGIPIKYTGDFGIVGTDGEHYSPLLQLFIWLEKDQLKTPDCLAIYLKNERAKEWTRELNKSWLEKIIVAKTPSVYVAHPQVCHALDFMMEREIELNEANFNKYYAGKKNNTYPEIIVLIKKGYVKIRDTKYEFPEEKGVEAFKVMILEL